MLLTVEKITSLTKIKPLYLSMPFQVKLIAVNEKK